MKRMRKDIAHVMDEATRGGETPCALTLLWRHDEEAFFYASGHADLGRSTPICRDSIFRLYSLTKPMTAVAAMTLVERGALDLLAPVSDFLEGFQEQRVAVSDTETEPVKRPMQVRDLFSMTSGLCYPGEASPAERATAALFLAFDQEIAEDNAPRTLDVANRIGQLPLLFHPGEKWQYGTSADVLGAIIEVVSGKPLDEYMLKAIFAPLGMGDTGFFVPEEKLDRLVTLYERKDSILSPYPEGHLGINPYLTRPNYIAGGAGAVSTIDDMLSFARMLLGKGILRGTRVLSPSSVAWLSHNHLNESQQSCIQWDSMYGYGYGGLVRVLTDPARSCTLGVAGEYGWDGWTGPYMSVCPEEDMALLVFQQLTDSGFTPLTRKIRNIVFTHTSS
ncbi:MAG: beta-lactamase family protein [Eubacteriales bacterium]|nr:beta-lactamase family protein [Eubacteriales bacterium]